MPTCQRTGCHRKATHRPHLRCWAVGHPKIEGQALKMELVGIELCRQHAEVVTVADLVTDEGWQMICDRLRMLGKAPPDRASLEISAQPIPKVH